MEIRDAWFLLTDLNVLNLIQLNFKIISYCSDIHSLELYFIQPFGDLFQLLNLIKIHEKYLQFFLLCANFNRYLIFKNQFHLNLCYYQHQFSRLKYFFKVACLYLPFKNQIYFHLFLQDFLQIYYDHHKLQVQSYKDETPSCFKSRSLSYQKIQF